MSGVGAPAAPATRGARALANARVIGSESSVDRALARFKESIEQLDARASDAPDRISESCSRFVEKRQDILDDIRNKDTLGDIRDYVEKYIEQYERLENRVMNDRSDYVHDFVRRGSRDQREQNEETAKDAFRAVKRAMVALGRAVEHSAQVIERVAN